MNYFGTDGIRAQVNEPPLTPEFVQKLGNTLAVEWEAGPENPIMIGHDGRLSADLLFGALQSGILSAGGSIVSIGLCTSPALSYLTGKQDVAGGIMISASHNPYTDNGLKPFHSSGRKLSPAEEQQIERRLESDSSLVDSSDVGRVHSPDDPLADYRQALRERTEGSNLSVLLDTAFGGGSRLAEELLPGLVGELYVINDQPDGRNINKDCGSLHVEQLVGEVVSRDCDLGFALDGDGDRVLAVTPEGSLLDGDRMLYLLARYGGRSEYQQGIVMTVMSNLALRNQFEQHDIAYEVTPVGDREVYDRLVDQGWSLGGEQSGHIIDRSWLSTGDGLNTMLRLLELFSEHPNQIEELIGELEPYPQVLHNVTVSDKPPLESLPQAEALIEEYEQNMEDQGRILVRYSGTEPVLRVMLEGKGTFPLEQWARELGERLEELIRSGAEAEPAS